MVRPGFFLILVVVCFVLASLRITDRNYIHSKKNGERNKREEQNWNQTEERKDGGGKKNNRGRMRGEKDEAGGQSYLPRKRLCLCFSGFVSLMVLMTCLEQPGFGVSCCLGLQFATSIVTFIGTNSHHIYMDLSQNRGTPKSSRLRLFV